MQTQQSLNVTDFRGFSGCFMLSKLSSRDEAFRVSMLLALARSAISPNIIAFLLVWNNKWEIISKFFFLFLVKGKVNMWREHTSIYLLYFSGQKKPKLIPEFWPEKTSEVIFHNFKKRISFMQENHKQCWIILVAVLAKPIPLHFWRPLQILWAKRFYYVLGFIQLPCVFYPN